MPVKLVLVRQGGGGVTSVPTATTTPTSSPTSSSTTTTATTTSSSSSSSSSSSQTSTTSSVSSTFTTSTVSSTSSPTATATGGPLPYTDLTSKGFAFVGCSPEARRANDGLDRTLTGAKFADDGMTNEKCLDFCTTKGFKYAGTEYRRECYCGGSVAPTRQPKKTVASLADCGLTCMGNTAQYCGGLSWLSLYEKCAAGSPCVNAQFT